MKHIILFFFASHCIVFSGVQMLKPAIRSLRAEWLDQASHGHEMYCYDLEVMSSNPSQVDLGVRCTSVRSRT